MDKFTMRVGFSGSTNVDERDEETFQKKKQYLPKLKTA